MRIYLVIAGAIASLFVAASVGHTQGSCRERDRCTSDSAAKEAQKEAARGVQRVIQNPDGRGRVKEAAETIRCIVRCVNEVAQDAVKQSNSQQSSPDN